MYAPKHSTGVMAMACMYRGECATREALSGGGFREPAKRVCRETQTRPFRVADGVVVPLMSGNADGGKDP